MRKRFGTRWVVWVGGVALALGGIFLVRYTIQRGLIGPGVRIAMGALLALALVAIGEWARRKERLSGLPGLLGAHSERADGRRHHRGLCHRLLNPPANVSHLCRHPTHMRVAEAHIPIP